MALSEYELSDGIATITLADGKVNALSSQMLGDIAAKLDRAEAEATVVVLTGEGRTFSAGFDLRTEPDGWPGMLIAGAGLAKRVMSFPKPVLVACNGNALAMAAFLLLSADYRLGVRGDFRIGLNEAMIGLTVPWFGIAIARHRLTRPYFDRCTTTGVVLGPDEAQAAGFLDEVADPGDFEARTEAVASELAAVKPEAHLATKLRTRAEAIAGVEDGIERIKTSEPSDW